MATNESGFFKNVMKVASGTTLSQAVVFLSAPLLARMFSPEVFGVAEIVITIAGAWNVVSSLSYERALVLPGDDEDGANLFLLALGLDVGSSILMAGLLVVLGAPLAKVLNIESHWVYLWFLPVLAVITGLQQAFDSWNSRRKEFGRLSKYRVVNSGTGIAAQLAAGYAGYIDAGGVLIGKIVGPGIATAFQGRAIWERDGQLLRRSIDVRRMWSLAVRYWQFPVFNTLGSLVNNVAWQVPVWMLGAYFSPEVVGIYALGNRLIRLPMTLIGSAIAQVFYREASQAEHQGTLGQVVAPLFRRLVALGLIPTIILAFAGEALFTVFLGARWGEAGVYTEILAPFVLVWFISSPISQLMSVKEKQGVGLVWQVAILICRVIPLWVGGSSGDAQLTMQLFSASGFLIYGLFALWLLRISQCSVREALSSIAHYGLRFSWGALLLAASKWWWRPAPMVHLALACVVGIGLAVIAAMGDSAIKNFLLRAVRRTAA